MEIPFPPVTFAGSASYEPPDIWEAIDRMPHEARARMWEQIDGREAEPADVLAALHWYRGSRAN